MAFKVVLFLALAAFATATPIGTYDFSYEVPNSHKHTQTSDGDVIRGSYTVIDPNGVSRTITYTADDSNGFVIENSEQAAPASEGSDDGSYRVAAGPDGNDGSYRPEAGEDGDDGTYHPEADEAVQVRGADGEDGSYHEEATHNEGVAEGQYSEAYNPIRLVPVPLNPNVFPGPVPLNPNVFPGPVPLNPNVFPGPVPLNPNVFPGPIVPAPLQPIQAYGAQYYPYGVFPYGYPYGYPYGTPAGLLRY